jgi:hypothetical protein
VGKLSIVIASLLLSPFEGMDRFEFCKNLLLGGDIFAFIEFQYFGIQKLFPFGFEEMHRELPRTNFNNIKREDTQKGNSIKS